jgi:pyruvate formate lyase activating enzyme
MDPIEKKPLYHFHPGEQIFSIGSMGCNLRCQFCQNWQISQGEPPLDDLSPAQAVREALRNGSRGIAYTYNEPMIWFEYVMDTGRAAREAGLYNVLVTNGFVNEAPLDELLEVTDAMNIDLKSFDDSFYEELCGASVEPVKRVIVRAARGCHVEITTLVIPNRNDSMPMLEEEAKWISSEVGRGTPVHLSAYFPRYKLDEPPTSEETLLKAREVFCRYLDYVYLGNVAAADGSDTVCAGCGGAVVRRRGYRVSASGMSPDGSCAACGARCGIVTGARHGGAGDAS